MKTSGLTVDPSSTGISRCLAVVQLQRRQAVAAVADDDRRAGIDGERNRLAGVVVGAGRRRETFVHDRCDRSRNAQAARRQRTRVDAVIDDPADAARCVGAAARRIAIGGREAVGDRAQRRLVFNKAGRT